MLLAIGLSLAFWVIGENFGTLFTSGGTDVNSGPLLVLLSIAYWGARPKPVDDLDARVAFRSGRTSEMTGMSGPGWLADLFAGVMILVAVYSAGPLGERPVAVTADPRRRRSGPRDDGRGDGRHVGFVRQSS